MIVDNKFEIGNIVYLKTDNDQLPRIVTSIHLKPNLLVYELSSGGNSSWHYEFEISNEVNVLMTIKN